MLHLEKRGREYVGGMEGGTWGKDGVLRGPVLVVVPPNTPLSTPLRVIDRTLAFALAENQVGLRGKPGSSANHCSTITLAGRSKIGCLELDPRTRRMLNGV